MEQIQDQPPPIPNKSEPVWKLVIEDMKARDSLGRERYGTPLQTNNGRDALVDAYQEVLDFAVYIRQEIEERKIRKAHIEDCLGSFFDPDSLFLKIAHGDRDHQDWLRKELDEWFLVRTNAFLKRAFE